MKTTLPTNFLRLMSAIFLALFAVQVSLSQDSKTSKNNTPLKGHALYKKSKIYDSKTGPIGLKPKSVPDRALDRYRYEQGILQNPKTKKVPDNIKLLEAQFSSKIAVRSLSNEAAKKSEDAKSKFSAWKNRGPVNVGGRTRALALDRKNENVIFAGGVSGGLWRSKNQGQTWKKVTLPTQDPSITAIVQDPRHGKHRIWYYASGERFGNSASGGNAFYAGTGVFKSIDNGLSWSKLPGSNDEDLTRISAFDIIHNIAVDPKNGDVYVATLVGIYRSQDGGNDFKLVLPGEFDSTTDILITPKGKIYATVDLNSGENAGFFVSDNGDDWTNITPANIFPAYGRTVMAADPSDDNRVYFLSEDLSGFSPAFLWRYQADAETQEQQWADLSENLPTSIGGFVGNLNLQGNYNMVVRVHPTNPDIVFVGGTNLYRSTTGFTTPLGAEGWIGGYNFTNDVSAYPNHHPDQHNLLFLPSDPNKAISANDGGVQLTNDITRTDAPVEWISLNNGYVTTQPYTVSFDPEGNGDDLLAGFQDNGTWFTSSRNPRIPWELDFGGDGAYNAIADGGQSRYVSSQRGRVFRLIFDDSGQFSSFTRVDPAGGSNFAFVAPFILDPVNDNIMYMPAGDRMWRNNDLDGIPLLSNSPTKVNWVEQKNTITPDGSSITALGVSKYPIANRLYYGTNSGKVFRVDNANVDDQEVRDISSGTLLPNGYVNHIYVDPKDPDQVFVVYSNYGIPSIFRSRDGGESWQDISGNLEENRDGSGNGPSVRWFAMNGRNDGYFAASSTGLYHADLLRGKNTIWSREPVAIGNGVVTQVKTRADGFVAAAVHGNGLFSANFVVRPLPEARLKVAYLLADKTVPINSEPFDVDITKLFTTRVRNTPVDIELTNSNPDLVSAELDGDTIKISIIAADTEGSAAIGLVATVGREQVSEGFTVNVVEPAIYGQTEAVANGIVSQNFLDFGNSIAQVADDFTIPMGVKWKVNRISTEGSFAGSSALESCTVVIYEDNDGVPGEEVYHSGSITLLSDANNPNANIELPEEVELASGTYWLSVYANLAFEAGNLWRWSAQSEINGKEGMWRDPVNLFGYGELASDWVKNSLVTVNGQPFDHIFQIFGQVDETLMNDENTVSVATQTELENSQNTELAALEAKSVAMVWPNPSTDQFYFSLKENVDDTVTARIFNLLGQQVHEQTEIDTSRFFSWDASNVPSGMYIIKITGEHTNKKFNVIKQ